MNAIKKALLALALAAATTTAFAEYKSGTAEFLMEGANILINLNASNITKKTTKEVIKYSYTAGYIRGVVSATNLPGVLCFPAQTSPQQIAPKIIDTYNNDVSTHGKSEDDLMIATLIRHYSCPKPATSRTR